MKMIRFLLLGIFFGIILTKGQIVSWYRIYEMFQFDNFHMYGVIGSAVVLGAIFVAISKKRNAKAMNGEPFQLITYPKGWKRYLIGGTIFGLGWAMTGACPGPLFILIGNGYMTVFLAIAGAILGTMVYAMLRGKLPH
ncbi:YeeE/YedE family protein [Sanyastnella coralliicola]|uniref:YeeE/YedE family protein n=1 Tax=Sanyastnella coralliicola TaxID=3069118 RepID=UPI0027BB0505|nr:DUF6691 family protein [Longitalea sp. SCSIO 12813]